MTYENMPRVISCLFQKVYNYGLVIAARVTVAAVHYQIPASFLNIVMKSIDYTVAFVNSPGTAPKPETVKIRLKNLDFFLLCVRMAPYRGYFV